MVLARRLAVVWGVGVRISARRGGGGVRIFALVWGRCHMKSYGACVLLAFCCSEKGKRSFTSFPLKMPTKRPPEIDRRKQQEETFLKNYPSGENPSVPFRFFTAPFHKAPPHRWARVGRSGGEEGGLPGGEVVSTCPGGGNSFLPPGGGEGGGIKSKNVLPP